VINKLYGMLAPGALSTEFYYRKTTQPEVYFAERDVLLPQTQEKAYLQFCANQLCHLASMNKLASVLQTLDPNNTYTRAAEQVEDELTEIAGIPAGFTVNIMEPSSDYNWVRRQLRMSFDGTDTVTYDDVKTVTWGLTGTGVMESGGLRIALVGPPPTSTFVASASFVLKPARDLLQLLEDLDALEGVEWVAQLEPYKDCTMPATRLVAYVLNALAKL